MSKKTFNIIGVILVIVGAALLIIGGNGEEEINKLVGFVVAGAGIIVVAWQFIKGLINK